MNDIDNCVGALYDIFGKKVSSISLELPKTELKIEGAYVSVSIVPSEDNRGFPNLHVQSQDDMKEFHVQTARQNHFSEIEQLVITIKKKTQDIQSITNRLEEFYQIETRDEYSGEDLAKELQMAICKRAEVSGRLKSLKAKEEIMVHYNTGKSTAILKPGLLTLISFIKTPLVWIPFALSEEVSVEQETKKSIAVPVGATGFTDSKIINDTQLSSCLFALFKTSFHAKQLTNSAKGLSTTNFDNSVLGKGNLFTLIENDQGYIFGGFVVDKFEVPSRWVGGNPENFIFSFGKRDEVIFPPVKLHPSNGNCQNIHLGSCGLHMSSDIVAFCSWSVGKNGYTKLAEGEYSVLISETVGGNAGDFTPVRAEVYEVFFS